MKTISIKQPMEDLRKYAWKIFSNLYYKDFFFFLGIQDYFFMKQLQLITSISSYKTVKDLVLGDLLMNVRKCLLLNED